VSQIDQSFGTPAIIIRPYSGTTGPGSIAANSNTEVNATSQPVDVNDQGWVMFYPGVTPANNVRPGTFRCTTAGTAIISWNNPTAGALTPTAPTATTPYLFVIVKSGL